MDFSFEQNQTVDSLDKVPAPFSAFYVEGEDKKFKIDDKFREVTKSIDGLNKTSKTLRGEEKKLKEQVAKWATLGEDPDAVQATIDELNEKLAKGEKINPEKIKADMNAAFEKERNGFKTEKEQLEGAVRKHLITSVATAAISEAKGSVDLLLPHIERQVKMVKADNGEYKVVVVDAQGETRYGANGSELSIKELVGNMKGDKVFGRAFESDSAGGGGADPKGSTRPKPGAQPNQEAPKSSIDKIAAGLKARQAG